MYEMEVLEVFDVNEVEAVEQVKERCIVQLIAMIPLVVSRRTAAHQGCGLVQVGVRIAYIGICMMDPVVREVPEIGIASHEIEGVSEPMVQFAAFEKTMVRGIMRNIEYDQDGGKTAEQQIGRAHV